MIQDAHTKKIALPVIATAGATTTVVAAVADAYIYVHELIGDLSADGTLEVLSGTTSLAKFRLDKGQGLTLQDEPGMDGVPRFQCKPGEAFILKAVTGTFNGAIDYSLRY
jgi:hypothetical protein